MQQELKKSYFKELFFSGNKLEVSLKVTFAIIVLASISFFLYKELWFEGAGIIASVALAYFAFIKPVSWIYAAVMFFPVYAHSRKDDIGVEDIISATLYSVILLIWFLSQLFYKKKKIIHNMSDWIIIFLFVILIFHSLINIFNDSDILQWMREYLILSIILMYFPIRELIKTRKELNTLLITFSISTIINAGLQFKYFYDLLNTIELTYAYQLLMGVRINQFYFTAAAFFGLYYFFSQKKLWHYIYVGIVTILSFGAMFISLSRTYWLFYAMGVVFFFFFLPAKKKILFMQFSGIVVAVFIVAVFLFWQENASMYLKAMETRLASSSKGKKDISLLMRLKEYEAAYKRIKQYPLGGSGLNAKFSFYDQYNGVATNGSNIHNGYISLVYRAGFVIAAVYFLFYFGYLLKSLKLIPKARDEFLRPLALGTFTTILLFFAANITSGQFIYKEAVFTMGFVLAFVSILENIIKRENNGDQIIYK